MIPSSSSWSLLPRLLVLASLFSLVEATPPPLAFFAAADMNLWALRGCSAAISYVGLVAFLDRPKGNLLIDPSLIKVGQSTVEGAGLGLFCNSQVLRKGTKLGCYPGTVLALDQNLVKLRQYPWVESYVWRFSDSKMVIDPTDAEGYIQDFAFGGNPMTPGSTWICQNLLPFLKQPTTLCRVNEPPIGRDVNVRTDEDLDQRSITFLLERDVYEGEEFFMDYGITYDRSNYSKLPSEDS